MINQKVAVHCDTEEKAQKFLKFCLNIADTTLNVFELIPTVWCWYKKDTCYILKGDIDWYNYKVGGKEYLQSRGYKIVEFEDFLKNTSQIGDTKTENKSLIEDVVISEIHKNNCEIEILEYLQKWILEQNKYLKSNCEKQDKIIKDMKNFTKV